MWTGFDPRAEPLDTEILKEWEEDGVVLKVLRYRIGIFKGQSPSTPRFSRNGKKTVSFSKSCATASVFSKGKNR